MWPKRSNNYCCSQSSASPSELATNHLQQNRSKWLSRTNSVKMPLIIASFSAISILILINNIAIVSCLSELTSSNHQAIDSRWSPETLTIRSSDEWRVTHLSRSKRHQQSISDEEDRILASHDRLEMASHHEPMALVDDSGVNSGSSDILERNQQAGGNLQQQQRGKRTLYACEERQLQIECQLGESIQLIRANYGRFSIQICNEHGQLDWKVNCMSPQSFQIISNSCQAKQSCQLLASNSIFGDACPGTQKYLEVHYQCVAANQAPQVGAHLNRTGSSSIYQPVRNNKPNVIQFDPQTTNINNNNNNNNNNLPSTSERPISTATMGNLVPQNKHAPALPNWIPQEALFNSNNREMFAPQSVAAPRNSSTTTTTTTTTTGKSYCPEAVWRQIRWPQTEPGMLVQMPCPAHAHSGVPSDAYAASLACLPGGLWAGRVQAARCQSLWLRNLTQRLEAGDSPLSIVAELVQRTQPTAIVTQPLSSSGLPGLLSAAGFWISNQQQQQTMVQTMPGLFGDDLVQLSRVVHKLVDETNLVLSRISDDKQRLGFGREMLQALIELANNLLNEHHLDAWLDLAPVAGERQRVAGQLVQDIEAASVQLAGVLSAATTASQDGQSSFSGQESFVKVTDNVYVTINSFALQPDQTGHINRSFEASFPSESSLLGTRWMNNEQSFTMHLQASGPTVSPTGQVSGEGQASSPPQVVDVKYSPLASPSEGASSPSMGNAQAESGQASPVPGASLSSQATNSGVQVLKIVFLMIRKLDAQMDPQMESSQSNQRMVVNSNLVSMSIVADPRFKYPSVKVDLAAPIELVFKHNDANKQQEVNNVWSNQQQQQQQMTFVRQRSSRPRCIYWDNIVSDWQSDGCKLVATNKTHSTCACNHLTTFALLTEWEEPSQLLAFNGSMMPTVALSSSQQATAQTTATATATTTTTATTSTAFATGWSEGIQINGNGQHHANEQPKVQLDSVENELILPNKLLYLAKLLDGHLFDQHQPITVALDGSFTGSNSSGSNLRLIIYLSCLISAGLFTLHLAAAAYNRAQARRLLGAIPVNPPPPLLVSNSNGSAAQLHPMLTGNRANHHAGQQVSSSATNSEHTSPTYGSSSLDYSAALSANRAKQLASNSSSAHHNNNNNNYDHLFQYQCVQKLATKQQLSVPIYLVVQLLALELIVILLVESQNYLQRMQTRRSANMIMMLRQQQQQQQQQQSPFAQNFNIYGPNTSEMDQPLVDPIGLITWSFLLAFYYLIASILSWLASQLLEINLDWLALDNSRLVKSGKGKLRTSNSTNSSVASDKSAQYGITGTSGTAATNSTAFASSVNPVGSSIYGSGSARLDANQLYLVETGQASCYGRNNGPFQSSTSPSSSLSSSAGEQHLSQLQQQQQQQQQQPGRHLMTTASRQRISPRRAGFLKRLLLGGLISRQANKTPQVNKFLVHLFPILLAAFIGWLAANRSQIINSLTYTNSLGSQLAYWPLLVDCSSSGLSLLLYYLPAVCFVLAGLALFCLGRRGSSGASGAQLYSATNQRAAGQHNKANFMMYPGAAKPIASSIVNPYGNAPKHLPGQVAVSKQSGPDGLALVESAAAANCEGSSWQQPLVLYETKRRKRAKFLCYIILALLALHSICWISFFAHVHLALNARDYFNRHLIVAFAASNLLFALLLVCSQRRLYRRAAKLAGLGRLLASCCCCLCWSTSSPGSSFGGRRAWFYRHQVGSRAGGVNGHQQQAQANGGGGQLAKGDNPLKVSPSSQSLFLISQANQQQQPHQHQHQHQHRQQQFAPNYHYGPTYSSGSSQAAQHLYQQLGGSSGAAHIYDSASTLNEQQRLDMMRMMQQQQQQINHHQYNSYTLNRPPVNSNQQFQQQQQQQRGQPMAATLKPALNNQVGQQLFRHSPGDQVGQVGQQEGQLLTLDAGAALKQLQWSGEAEGPLVAFGGCNQSNQVAFGPNHSQVARSSASQHQQEELSRHLSQQQQQQHLTEHQLFSQNGHVNRHVHLSRPASPTSEPPVRRQQLCQQQQQQQQQQQYCANQSGNYTDALRAAMIQQQNELAAANELNFRRANATAGSKQFQQRHLPAGAVFAGNDDRRHCNQFDLGAHQHHQSGNIYDVANYNPN